LRATIPLAAATESLNVAAAAAICLFEGLRQHGKAS
jgi:tRNA G18 (ribose-2'-O)-methylase SpoU